MNGCHGATTTITNPSDGSEVGSIAFCSEHDIRNAVKTSRSWSDTTTTERSDILRKAADLYETHTIELFSLLMREAGKTLIDCVGEVREAVDFLRYYAAQAENGIGEDCGIFACISPWNFPLAIFTGQISAALAAGNGVLAKPAETTPLIAFRAVELMHEAGVPKNVLQLMPGTGKDVGSELTSDKKVDGVCFTGSTQTAQTINRSMAKHLAPSAPLIAETGGLNAMIVDSTALPEQAIADILASAFQSAGQRCSALRILYLQEDIADPFLEMLFGAMDELQVGDPCDFSTDIGPVIDAASQSKITAYISVAKDDGRLIKQIDAPDQGYFVPPSVISVGGIEELEEEVFGPVLHVATFKNTDFLDILHSVNAKNYGLTFGLHSRIDDRVQQVVDALKVGNIYVNRNQIGAVVGSQPFGGEGLSGTGPKAGGPCYIKRFLKSDEPKLDEAPTTAGAKIIKAAEIEKAFAQQKYEPSIMSSQQLPGPTGESNTYSTVPRDRVLCLGPGADQAQKQAEMAREIGCRALAAAPGVRDGLDGVVSPQTIAEIAELDAVVSWQGQNTKLRQALAGRDGPLVPLFANGDFAEWLIIERHTCVDTTAAGGNAQLING